MFADLAIIFCNFAKQLYSDVEVETAVAKTWVFWGFSKKGNETFKLQTEVEVVFIVMPTSFFVSSWPCLSSTTDALQPGCVHTRPAGVPAETSDPAAAQRSTCWRRLPSPASIQPRFCCTTTLAWIVDVRAAALGWNGSLFFESRGETSE